MGIFKRETLSDRLKGEAISLGLCDKWQKEWKKNTSKDELAEKFIKGIDFVTKHNWPSPEFIKENFDADLRRRWGVFVDEDADVAQRYVGQLRTLVFLGDSSGELCFYGNDVKDVYVRHGSKLRIKASGNSVVFVTTFDDVDVHIDAAGGSKVFVYRYSGNVSSSGHVVLRERTVDRLTQTSGEIICKNNS